MQFGDYKEIYGNVYTGTANKIPISGPILHVKAKDVFTGHGNAKRVVVGFLISALGMA